MMLRLFLFFSLWTVFELRASEAALQQLDRVLDERDYYVALREAELTAVRAELVVTVEPVARFTLLGRSEEHTSELQSRPHLVCRLLLEKKKKQQQCICCYCIL